MAVPSWGRAAGPSGPGFSLFYFWVGNTRSKILRPYGGACGRTPVLPALPSLPEKPSGGHLGPQKDEGTWAPYVVDDSRCHSSVPAVFPWKSVWESVLERPGLAGARCPRQLASLHRRHILQPAQGTDVRAAANILLRQEPLVPAAWPRVGPRPRGGGGRGSPAGGRERDTVRVGRPASLAPRVSAQVSASGNKVLVAPNHAASWWIL